MMSFAQSIIYSTPTQTIPLPPAPEVTYWGGIKSLIDSTSATPKASPRLRSLIDSIYSILQQIGYRGRDLIGLLPGVFIYFMCSFPLVSDFDFQLLDPVIPVEKVIKRLGIQL
jgi:hypothetical protein